MHTNNLKIILISKAYFLNILLTLFHLMKVVLHLFPFNLFFYEYFVNNECGQLLVVAETTNFLLFRNLYQ